MQALAPRRRLSRRFVLSALALALALPALLSREARAHVPQYMAGTRTTVSFFEDRVELLFDLSYRGIWAHSEMLSADTDRDSVVSRAEADAYLERQWRRKILKLNEKGERITRPALRCRLDGEEVALELVKSEHEELVGEAYPGPFALYYTIHLRAPGGIDGFSKGAHELEFVDLVLDGEIPGKPRLSIPFRGHSNEPTRFRVRTEFKVPGPDEVLADGLSELYFTEADRFVLRFEFLERAPGGSESSEAIELPGATSFPPPAPPLPPEIESTLTRKLPIDSKELDDEELLSGALEIDDDLSPSPEEGVALESHPDPQETPASETPADETPASRPASEALAPRALSSWEERASTFFANFLSSPTRLGLGAIAGYLLLAFLYGAGHAFTPGHGKTMVAAYLLGSRGRVRDAIVLGFATTLTHTLTVYTVGVITLYMSYRFAVSDQAAAQRVSVWMSILSGLLLVVLGLAIYFRRALAFGRSSESAHTHSHRHAEIRSHAAVLPASGVSPATVSPATVSPAPGRAEGTGASSEITDDGAARRDPPSEEIATGHRSRHLEPVSEPDDIDSRAEPDTPTTTPATTPAETEATAASTQSAPERPRLYELLALGISGGLLPCPAAIFVILVALQSPTHLGLGLSGLLLFGVGLGSVLILTGVLLVTGKSLATGRLRSGAFLEAIPLLRRIFGRALLARGDRAGLWLLRVLPIASCLFIAALGAFFVARACVLGSTEIRATLESLGL